MVCKVEQGLLPVRVINMTNDALTLKSGMNVGTLFTDIEVGDEVEQYGDSAERDNLQPWLVDMLMSPFGVEEKGFSPGELEAIRQLLHHNTSVFSQGKTDLGRTHLTLHKIDTGEARPPLSCNHIGFPSTYSKK